MCTPLWRGTMAVYRFLASAPQKNFTRSTFNSNKEYISTKRKWKRAIIRGKKKNPPEKKIEKEACEGRGRGDKYKCNINVVNQSSQSLFALTHS